MSQTLSSDEQMRAERFRFAHDRRRYIVAHGMMRAILADYLDMTPQQIRFVTGDYGKPALAPDQGQIDFNLSHSEDLAIVACTYNRELGVDIEYMRPLDEIDLIAAHFFAPAERAVLLQMAEEQKLQAFYACWTHKEAYIKAIGLGLAMPLDRFVVSLGLDEDARLLWVEDQPQEQERWQMRALTPPSGYAATILVAGTEWELTCWRWQPDND
jgi:4'-phosphopantetheinyl transferase